MHNLSSPSRYAYSPCVLRQCHYLQKSSDVHVKKRSIRYRTKCRVGGGPTVACLLMLCPPSMQNAKLQSLKSNPHAHPAARPSSWPGCQRPRPVQARDATDRHPTDFSEAFLTSRTAQKGNIGLVDCKGETFFIIIRGTPGLLSSSYIHH